MLDRVDDNRGRGLLLSSVLAVAVMFALSAVLLRVLPQTAPIADVALALALAAGLHLLAAYLLERALRRRS